MGSCSTPESPSETPPPSPESIPVDYTIIFESGDAWNAAYVDSDGTEMTRVDGPGGLDGTPAPALWHRGTEGVGYSLPGDSCLSRAGYFSLNGSPVAEAEVLTGLDPCKTEVLSLAHKGSIILLGLKNSEAGEKDPRYLLRRVELGGGAAIDLELSALPVDLETDGSRVFVLTHDELEGNATSLKVARFADLSDTLSLDLDVEARTLAMIGNQSLLIGYPELHTILDTQTLQVQETVRYQDGFQPGFLEQSPFSSADGSLLFYTYAREEGDIAALYKVAGRTAVLYFFENYLSPDQISFQYDIHEATAVGYDEENGLLLVGYAKASAGGLGGILRLRIEPDLVFVDQLDLPGIPRLIFSE